MPWDELADAPASIPTIPTIPTIPLKIPDQRIPRRRDGCSRRRMAVESRAARQQ
ncbi:hypothetical protein BH23GEM9_BH23GEM9_10260 [soil metagenome]